MAPGRGGEDRRVGGESRIGVEVGRALERERLRERRSKQRGEQEKEEDGKGEGELSKARSTNYH